MYALTLFRIVPLFKTNRRVDILDLSSDLQSTREHVPTLEENES